MHVFVYTEIPSNPQETDMRYQQGSTPKQGSQPGKQQGQMSQSSEQKLWPYKGFEYPAETGQPEFTLESLKEEAQRKASKSKQVG